MNEGMVSEDLRTVYSVTSDVRDRQYLIEHGCIVEREGSVRELARYKITFPEGLDITILRENEKYRHCLLLFGRYTVDYTTQKASGLTSIQVNYGVVW